jgi:hypothetical protein
VDSSSDDSDHSVPIAKGKAWAAAKVKAARAKVSKGKSGAEVVDTDDSDQDEATPAKIPAWESRSVRAFCPMVSVLAPSASFFSLRLFFVVVTPADYCPPLLDKCRHQILAFSVNPTC